jgi:hypothetical protein
MLVQPALTTHLLCRPVSIADSRWKRKELQVLCGMGGMCYGFGLLPAACTISAWDKAIRERFRNETGRAVLKGHGFSRAAKSR